MIMTLGIKTFLLVIALVLLFTGGMGAAETGPQPPRRLRCEYLENPMAVDVKAPRFSWILDHSQRGQSQSAYQVLVSTHPAAESGELWDSGKVSSGQSTNIIYRGKSLESGQTCFWRVRWWDKDGVASPYSETARFDTGLLAKDDWQGQWITGNNQLRKEVELKAEPVRGRAYICGLGYYELDINGQKVGTSVLDPGWTVYGKHVLYAAYDITPHLRQGLNAFGVILGKGWSPVRTLLLQVNIMLADGSKVHVQSDMSWKQAKGPIVSDSIFDGEIYDARLETPGWTQPGFDDSAWMGAQLGVAPEGLLSAQMMPSIKVVDTLLPRDMTNPKPGVYVFDMGQNFSGWARLRVQGPRGTRVRLRFAELLYDTGMINTENLRTAKAEDIYILKGGDEEVYEPRFTYHGFRYVEITGYPGVPELETLQGRVVHTAVEQTGHFACSKPLLNQIQRLILWGQRTNLHSIPTDCCQRDERMGWLGDAHVTAEEALMNFDMAAFYSNFLRLIRDVQDERGTITDTVPHVWGKRPADPAWGAAYPLLCWYMYMYHGDRRLLEEHYESIQKYVEFLRSKAKNGLVTYSHYGDWVALVKTPGRLVSSFYYYYAVDILAKMAKTLGRSEEAESYRELAQTIRSRFNSAYYDQESRAYGGGTQTANTLPLFLDLPPEEERDEIFDNLLSDIIYNNNTHLTTGIIGTKYIFEVLTRNGRADLAYDLAVQTSYPSWGYMIENGATTLWELWQHRTGPGMNSHNHPMFGSVGAWLYKALVGINTKEGSPGFQEIVIKPQMVRDLQHASGAVQTPHGRVSCAWSKSEQEIRCEVIIPINSSAEIVLPVGQLENVVLQEGETRVYSNQKLLTGVPGILGVEESTGHLTIKVGSGRFVFVLTGR